MESDISLPDDQAYESSFTTRYSILNVSSASNPNSSFAVYMISVGPSFVNSSIRAPPGTRRAPHWWQVGSMHHISPGLRYTWPTVAALLPADLRRNRSSAIQLEHVHILEPLQHKAWLKSSQSLPTCAYNTYPARGHLSSRSDSLM